MSKATKPASAPRTMMTEHFAREEFACRCGCGRSEVRQALASALEGVRLQIGVPLAILSGYRCPEHNAKVGGAKNSKHTLGIAADVSCRLGWKAIYDAALRIPALAEGGIGVSAEGNYVHLDVRDGMARWAYRNGKVAPFDQTELA